MSRRSFDEGVREADEARAELYTTLGQLRERLDYAHRLDVALERAKLRVAKQREENPVGFAIGIMSVAAAAGFAVWGIARLITRAFD